MDFKNEGNYSVTLVNDDDASLCAWLNGRNGHTTKKKRFSVCLTGRIPNMCVMQGDAAALSEGDSNFESEIQSAECAMRDACWSLRAKKAIPFFFYWASEGKKATIRNSKAK